MSETAFQVHYQYVLSQYWMNDAKTNYMAKAFGTGFSKHAYAEKVELEKQLRDLQKMYPDYYANWLKEHELRELKSRTNVVD